MKCQENFGLKSCFVTVHDLHVVMVQSDCVYELWRTSIMKDVFTMFIGLSIYDGLSREGKKNNPGPR